MVLGKIFTLTKNTLEKVFKTSKATLRSILIFILVFGLEKIFEKDVFKCPVTKHRLYGTLFLFGPALCLFVLTLLLNTKFWDALTGCRLSKLRVLFVLKRSIIMMFQACLPSGVWVVVALLQTNYYVCMKLGPMDAAIKKATRNITDKEAIKKIKDDIAWMFHQAETDSYINAWILFISLVLIAFFAVCIRRLLFLESDGILPDLDDYQKLEAEAAVDCFKNKIQEIAASEGKNYVTKAFENSKMNSDLKSEYSRAMDVRYQIAWKYPRTTGDLSQPFRKEDNQTGDISEVNDNTFIYRDSPV